jgi:hypothetical protein
VRNASKVTSITESVTTYTPSTTAISSSKNTLNVHVFTSPSSEFIAIQANDLTKENMEISLYDMTGKLVQKSILYQGSTITYMDARTLYNGQYLVHISDGKNAVITKVLIAK